MAFAHTSSDVIEMHVKAHSMLIAATGQAPTEYDREIYRNALQALVRLAKNESLLAIEQDLQSANQALRG